MIIKCKVLNVTHACSNVVLTVLIGETLRFKLDLLIIAIPPCLSPGLFKLRNE